jgi:protocatechuate 3,4-dioxygenase, beta subunit
MRGALPLLLVLLVGCGPPSPPRASEAQESAAGTITVALCGPDEPGKKLVFSGRVLDYQGRPLAKAAVVAHQADERGLYTPKGATSRVPRLRGVAVTDERGRFRFSTVWPGAYPEGSQPAHIHVGVMAHEHRVRFVTFWFEGDALLTEQRRKDSVKDPEVRIVKPSRERDGVWQFEHDIRLEEA